MSVSRNRAYSYPKTVTVRDVYGMISAFGPDAHVSIPEGYEYVDFRPPKRREWIVGAIVGKAVEVQENFPENEPRIIIRKKLIKKYWLVETLHTADAASEQFPPYVATKTNIRLAGTGMQAQFCAQPIELTDNPTVYGGPQGAKYFRTKVRGE